MKPTKSSIKRKIDKLISEEVRKRGYCVKCRKPDQLNAAHIFSRSNMATRWDMDNILCLCVACHFWAHHNPVLFTEFVREYLGEERYQNLKQRAMSIRIWKLDEMVEFYNERKADA